MIGASLDRRVFMDDARVKRALRAAERRNWTRIGGIIRTTARRSIRRRADHLPPRPAPNPPSSRTGDLRRFLFFGWDFSTRSVVVGPKLRSGKAPLRSTARTVPELLEFGGAVRRGAGRTSVYRARPYMGPAFEQNQERIREVWRDSIR